MSTSVPMEMTLVPRGAVEFPLVLPVAADFEVARVESWPVVTGRLEYVGGRLLYMPPCGDEQQRTAVDVTTELNLWRRRHPEFVVGGNEAGMLLGGEVRAADAAVWRKDALGPVRGGLPRTPPVLAVEVTGLDESAIDLTSKTEWYLDRGVEVVWIVDPQARTVVVVTAAGRQVLTANATLPPHPSLPGLAVSVASLFRQLD